MRKIAKSSELYVAITIIALSVFIGLISTSFFTFINMIDIIRSSIVTIIFALGTLIVIISGGIDVSFTAIASVSMYCSTKILLSANYTGSIILFFVIAALIGLLLGGINAALIAFFRLPTLIVTLGTSSIFMGVQLSFIGSAEISDVPQNLIEFSKRTVFTFTDQNGITSGLPLTVMITLLILIVTFFVLKYTYLGRGIYAIGGDRTAAERAGFNVKKIQFFVYSYVGFISGIAGMIYTIMLRTSNPTVLIGSELLVIAAVVLGGARVTGGHGTVIGTVLGVILVILIQNNLILLGIPSYWQRFVIGLLIIIGTGITAVQRLRAQNAVHEISED